MTIIKIDLPNFMPTNKKKWFVSVFGMFAIFEDYDLYANMLKFNIWFISSR